MDIQLSFIELRQKEVINVCDGKRLGRIIDIIFDLCGRVCGVVVPGPRRFFWWRSCEDIFIPWRKIDKIGNDVILVDLEVRHHHCREDNCIPPIPPMPPPRRKNNSYRKPPVHRDEQEKEYITKDYILHNTGKESIRYQEEAEEFEEDYDDEDAYPNPSTESRQQ